MIKPENIQKNLHLISLSLLAALIFSGSGLLLLFEVRHRAWHNFPNLFWFVLLWMLAQILLMVVAFGGLRSGLKLRTTQQKLNALKEFEQATIQSTGIAMMIVSLNGKISFFSPAAEQMLGYKAELCANRMELEDLFPEGECEYLLRRLTAGLGHLESKIPRNTAESVASLLQYVLSSSSAAPRGFEVNYLGKDGKIIPAMLCLSGIGPPEAIEGILCVSHDLSLTKRAEYALQESEERYRDLFENSNEMIAAISPRGQYLYVNPAWQRQFGISNDQRSPLPSFDSIFPSEIRTEISALFRQALLGMHVDAVPLLLRNPKGKSMEVEIRMSCRRENGIPVAVRCLLRDVTERNRRERRLRMQLKISQLIGGPNTTQVVIAQTLATLGTTLDYDIVAFWSFHDPCCMKLQMAWTKEEQSFAPFLNTSRSMNIHRGEDLIGLTWSIGEPQWICDFNDAPTFLRTETATMCGLNSGWAVPVKVGNQVIAVMELYSQHRLDEDHDITATIETICTSLGQFLDSSEQKARIAELNQQKDFLLNSMADGILGITPEGTIDFSNPAASRLLGQGTQQLIGKQAHTLLHGQSEEKICEQPCQTLVALQTLSPTRGQDNYLQRDGRKLPVEFSVMPIRAEKKVIGSVLNFRDSSQRRALDQLKDEFISTVSHELRTPLTSIHGSLRLLSSGKFDSFEEKTRRLLAIATSNCDRLIRLINDILNLERLQSGRAPLKMAPLSILQLIHQTLEVIQPLAEQAKIKIQLEIKEVMVMADLDRMLQVMTNLLSNAIKFSPADSEITVETILTDQHVYLNVIDQGRGIPADKLESIFDRFQQVDASDSRQKGGTGLGLSIARTIIEQHGGRIWAEQNSGPGATLRVVLPTITPAEE